MSKILILGAGAMGSAFTFPCIDNGHKVTLIGTHLENNFIDKIKNKNNFHKVLGRKLPKTLEILKFNKLKEKIKTKFDLIVVGVNSKGISWAAKEIGKFHNGKTPILLLTKGLTIINNKIVPLTYKFLHMMGNFSKFKNLKITAVAGPCIAKDLAKKIKTAVVFANTDLNLAKKISKLINTNYYEVECSQDLNGVEICAAIKNFYSMIIGSASNLNSSAVLMQKSVFEMVKFLKLFGGNEKTAYGLAGLGDLYVSSAGGRNSKMGKYLGDGYLYKKAKVKYMPNDTLEGAELAFELASMILNKSNKKRLPLMYTLVDSIFHNKKLKLKW